MECRFTQFDGVIDDLGEITCNTLRLHSKKGAEIINRFGHVLKIVIDMVMIFFKRRVVKDTVV